MRCSACLVLAVAALPVAGAARGPAHASAVTAGTNYQETSTRKSTSVPAAATCESVTTCFVIFNIIPAGKQLLVTDVQCSVRIVGLNADRLHQVRVITFAATGGATDRSSFLSPVRTATLASNNIAYTVNGTTRHPYKSGERPVIQFSTDDVGLIAPACTIMGKVGNPPE
jgi:hypothetical protein